MDSVYCQECGSLAYKLDTPDYDGYYKCETCYCLMDPTGCVEEHGDYFIQPIDEMGMAHAEMEEG